MALFMDVHTMAGPVGLARRRAGARGGPADAGALRRDYLRYWVDQAQGKIFCLVEAPDADAAASVHREAHGLVADEIYPVTEGA